MNAFQTEFPGILAALLVGFVGSASVIVSLFRSKGRDRTLLFFGIFTLLYGTRWLSEAETMRALLGAPFDLPYFHAVMTYLVPVPLGGFLYEVFGPGKWGAMRWVYWSMIAYVPVAVTIDIMTGATAADSNINPAVVIAWCVLGILNLIFVEGKERIDLLVVRASVVLLFVAVVNDNLVVFGVLPWSVRLEHFDLMIFCLGLGFVAIRHFLMSERKLLSIEQELALARRIQQSNLPKDLPLFSGVSVATRYVPMTAVAGDFYDIKVCGPNGIGILVADVSGHGVGAALIGSMLKVGYAAQEGHLDDPAAVLTALNRILQGKLDEAFVTACAVYIDLTRRTLRYANAGHPAPVLLRAGERDVRPLEAGGVILGPFPDASYENHDVPLRPHDRLVLYTDGVVETRDRRGELFGEERLFRLLPGLSSITPESAVDRIVQHVASWSGKDREESQDDDLTLVVADISLDTKRIL